MTPAVVRPVLRVLAVVALVLGILSMHGLVAGGHAAHGAMASPAASAAMSGEMSHDAARVGVSGPLTQIGAGVPTAAVVAGLGLCLAILLSGALLLRRTAAPWARPEDSAGCPVVRTQTVPPGRGPPRLLLAQLCVLRT